MLIDQLIKFIYYSLFFITPLAMSSATSELFEFNKMLFIYLIATLVGVLWLIKMVLRKRIIFKRTFLDIPILIFFAFQVISTLFSIDIHTSVFGYYGRFNGGLLSIIAYLVLFYGFVSNFDTDQKKIKAIENLLKVSLFSSLFVILWGLPGKLGHDMSCLLFTGQFDNSCWTDQFRPAERMFSTLGQPNWLGSYLSINFFIALFFLFKRKNDEETSSLTSKFLFFVYLFLNFASILFTRSRSALGATLFGISCFIIYFIVSNWKKKSFTNVKTFLIVILLVTSTITSFKTGVQKIDKYLDLSYYLKLVTIQKQKAALPVIKSSPTLGEDVTDSLNIRKIVWEGALKLGKMYPVSGTGVETFAYSYYFVRPISHNLTSEWDFLYNKAHNEFLNYLATTGLGGLLSYLLMILTVLFIGLRKLKNSLFFCLILSYISILITNFFGFGTTTVNLYFYIIPGIMILLDSVEAKADDAKKNNLSRIQLIEITLIVVAGVTGIIYLTLYYIADTKYAAASNYIKASEFQTASSTLQEALKLHYEHVYEDKLSTSVANLAFIASSQKEPDISKRLIAIADYYNKKSIKASPKNILYWKTAAKNEFIFFQITSDKKYILDAIDTLRYSRTLSPTDPKLPYSLAVFYSLLYDEEKLPTEKIGYQKLSLEAIDDSISLKPNFRDAYLLKGQLLKKYGSREDAANALKFVLEKINPNDDDVKKEMEGL